MWQESGFLAVCVKWPLESDLSTLVMGASRDKNQDSWYSAWSDPRKVTCLHLWWKRRLTRIRILDTLCEVTLGKWPVYTCDASLAWQGSGCLALRVMWPLESDLSTPLMGASCDKNQDSCNSVWSDLWKETCLHLWWEPRLTRINILGTLRKETLGKWAAIHLWWEPHVIRIQILGSKLGNLCFPTRETHLTNTDLIMPFIILL